MKTFSILTLVVTCGCALAACSGDECMDQDMDPGALSLLQKKAEKKKTALVSEPDAVSIATKLEAKTEQANKQETKKEEPKKQETKKEEAIKEEPIKEEAEVPKATKQEQAQGGLGPVHAYVNKFASDWEWSLTFNNWALIVGCIFCVIYEFCISGGFKLEGLFDQEWAGKWQYYSYGFYQYAVFGVCVPLSEPLSTALGYNPAWSGLLMTIMPAMEVPGIEIGRRLVMPFDQNFLCRWLCFGRLWMAASEAMWVIVLLSPSMVSNAPLCFWMLMLSRALLGLGSGMVNTPTTYMGVKWTSKERMKNMTSYATMAKRLGMSFGVITSSFCLEVFNMTNKTATVYQMAALPVAFTMAFGVALIIIFDVSCTRGQPPEEADQLKSVGDTLKEKPKVTLVVPTTEASLARRASIVLNSIIFNFTGSMQRESIDLSSTMVFAGYGISVVSIGYLIAAINFSAVVWIAGFTEFMKKGTWLDPAHLIVYYNVACCISGIFFFNWGTWWTFFAADCVCFSMTTAAIGISNGIATNAGIPNSHYSKDSFTAYRAQTTAGARFLSGPVARGAIFWTGRLGYALMFAVFLLISMYNNVVTRMCFLDKSDGHSEEDAQMNGVKRDGI